MNIDITVVRSWAELVLAIAAVGGLLYKFLRNGQNRMERNILEHLGEATKQIQPDQNGGRSLTDANRKLDAFRDDLYRFRDEVKDDINQIKRAVIQLEDDVEVIQNDLDG